MTETHAGLCSGLIAPLASRCTTLADCLTCPPTLSLVFAEPAAKQGTRYEPNHPPAKRQQRPRPPWRVAVEQGFFAAEGLTVEYHEDNPKGTAGRVEDFSQRWKESELQKGALQVYPVCEWGAIERVQALGGGKIIGLDPTVPAR